MMIYVHTYLYDVYNQSINQSINQSTNQPINQSINQSIKYVTMYIHWNIYLCLLIDTVYYIIYIYNHIFTCTHWLWTVCIVVFRVSIRHCSATVPSPTHIRHPSAYLLHWSCVINLDRKCVDRKLVLSILSTCISYCVWIYLIHPEIQILAFDLSDSPWIESFDLRIFWECRHVQ